MRRTQPAGGHDQTETTRTEFGERLRTLMTERGISAAETARRVREQLPGEKFSPAHVATYRQGRAIPRRRYLDALSLALGVEPTDLIGQPSAPADVKQEERTVLQPTSAQREPLDAPTKRVRLEGSGELAHLELHLEVPWHVALAVLHLLRGGSDNKD